MSSNKGKGKKKVVIQEEEENESFNEADFESLEIPINSTNIDLIMTKKEQEVFSYVDEAKKLHKCIVTMFNYITKDEIKNNCNCFWDRHPFDWTPLGIPISYVPKRITKEYYSEISKENYIISENISKNCDKKEASNITLQTEDYYEVDGVVCSFNCMLAFYEDNKHNPLYKQTYMLASKMYRDMFSEDLRKVYHAPSWRLLKPYGGVMEIEEYRKSFNKILYNNTEFHTRNIAKLRPVGLIYEERHKF